MSVDDVPVVVAVLLLGAWLIIDVMVYFKRKELLDAISYVLHQNANFAGRHQLERLYQRYRGDGK